MDPESPSPESPPPTLLLVDDEASILTSLRRLLRPLGYRLLLAGSAAEGLALLEREPVDLIISDMRMPEMDGAAFLERVRARWPEVLRILLTGYADMNSTIAAINRGEIYRYIAKPWNDSELLMIVRQALEQQQLRAENRRLQVLTQQQNEELRLLNASLEAKVQARTEELARSNESLKLANNSLRQHFLVSIKTFSSLMELRSGGVAGHARRVADLARRLAGRLELPAQDRQDVFLAGLLHDIGKIGFSDSLLAKPLSLMNGDDLGHYRRHATDGANAMVQVEELVRAAIIVRTHHERFDGQGFPDGLEGAAIPIGARILAVVDEYDGLQSGTRSERRLGPEAAAAEMARSGGRRFDPEVLAAFLAMVAPGAGEAAQELELSARELKPGMVMARDLRSREGALLLAADYVLDASLVRQIQGFAQREGVELKLHVRAERH